MSENLSAFIPSSEVPAALLAHSVSARRIRRETWSGPELAVLRRYYPTKGSLACRALLPDRTERAIYQRAKELGLSAPGMPPAYHRWTTSKYIDETIARYYMGKPVRGGVAKLGKQIGRPARWVSHRALQLGITPPRFAPLPWSAEEDVLLRKYAARIPSTISRVFRKHGFSRTPCAISGRMAQRSIERIDDDHYSGKALAQLFGVTGNVVYGWIAKGWLHAKTKGTTREHDFYRIHHNAIRRFVIENAGAVDLRRVDKLWFIDMLASEST